MSPFYRRHYVQTESTAYRARAARQNPPHPPSSHPVVPQPRSSHFKKIKNQTHLPKRHRRAHQGAPSFHLTRAPWRTGAHRHLPQRTIKPLSKNRTHLPFRQIDPSPPQSLIPARISNLFSNRPAAHPASSSNQTFY
jgi:hypothetical protein